MLDVKTTSACSFCLFLLLAAGCGGSPEVANPDFAPEDLSTRLGNRTDISLAAWLKLPRARLARMADEWAVSVEKLQEFCRTNVEAVQLLPQLHAPVTVPVFARCRWSEAAGVSLPPYLKEGDRDAGVALHLARHGDRSGALKLADPNDKDLLSQIDAWRTDQEYPLEWTRLVSLVLQAAQFKMAQGNVEGATELVLLHRQLHDLLDARAARGPLGAALLPAGRHAMQLAVEACRQPRVNKKGLALDLEAALADWGDLPAPVFGLPARARKAEIVRVFGRPAEGRAVVAARPEAVQRALDLLAVPVPPEGVEAVVAFLDGKERLDGVQVLYRPKINELFPEPVHLAHHLLEHGFAAKEPTAGVGLLRQVYEGGGLVYDLSVFTRGNAAGALIQLGTPVRETQAAAVRETQAATVGRNPRDFGAVSFDRSWEANRVGLVPQTGGDTLKLTDKKDLAKVTQPVTDYAPEEVVLQRLPGHDLLAGLRFTWDRKESEDTLYRLGLPLWAAYGRSQLEGKEDGHGGFLLLTWEQGPTRLRLWIPFDQHSPELTVEDTRGATDAAARVEAAHAVDRAERQARLAAGKAQKRLPRTLEVNAPATNGVQVEGLQLGMTKEEALATLPDFRGLRRQALPDGVNLLFATEPPGEATYWARQMFVRLGPGDRVAEVRIRYQEGPGKAGPKAPSLLDALKKKAGAPEELPGPWVGLWTDLGTKKVPVLYRWRDDVTVLTLQRDAGGAEVVLRDCPPDGPLGVDLPPLQFCSRGVPRCALGDNRADILRRHGVQKPHVLANGAEYFAESEDSPYDVLLVWYEKNRVSRIIARHRDKQPIPADGAGAALQQAWGAAIDRLGYVRRIEGPRGPVLGAYDWHDDVTRVRIFVQETDKGARLFTEFRNWPIAAAATPVVQK
jgi:hypothetical protein